MGLYNHTAIVSHARATSEHLTRLARRGSHLFPARKLEGSVVLRSRSAGRSHNIPTNSSHAFAALLHARIASLASSDSEARFAGKLRLFPHVPCIASDGVWAQHTTSAMKDDTSDCTGMKSCVSVTQADSRLASPAYRRAPQHPASHVFQTIPPRAPSRSSRSTILSYTLHLATSTRLSTYLAPNGARDLLHQAESLSTYKHKCAEASDDDVGAVVDLDPDFVESELKAQGMWKLGASLLRAAAAAQKQQQGIDGAVESSGLPPMVERRVALAALTENLLVTPEPDLVEVGHQPSDGGDHLVDALTNAENLTDQKSSGELDAICALKPLTSPDTTTLYNTSSTFNAGSSSSASASAASATGSSSLSPTAIFSSSARGSGSNPSSIAQSLINMKFGGVEEEAMTTLATNETGTTAMSLDDDKDKKPSNAAGPPSREAETVFASSHLDPASTSTTTTTTQSMTAPHMDYRIVRGQAMRSRARAIYATSILSPSAPSSTSTATARWCRRHRVLRCCVCRAIVDADSKIDRRTLNIPGQGLRDAVSPTTNATLPKRVLAQGGPGRTGRNKKTLAELVPDFLDLSAQLMKDQRERSTSSNDATTGVESTNAATEWTVTATASWYALLHAFLIQATLEGYLVEGWTGTGGIETLLGVGCGVWEGRGWDTRRDGVAVEREAEGGEKDKPEEVDEGNRSEQSDDSSSSSSSGDDDDDEDEEAEAAFERERAKDKLVAAAQALFGSRNVAQADFERSMRDRTHEVRDHLGLSASYQHTLN